MIRVTCVLVTAFRFGIFDGVRRVSAAAPLKARGVVALTLPIAKVLFTYVDASDPDHLSCGQLELSHAQRRRLRLVHDRAEQHDVRHGADRLAR